MATLIRTSTAIFNVCINDVQKGSGSDAQDLLAQLTGYATDPGLFTEEYDPVARRLAGNFPQAYSRLGFIRAVDALTEATGKNRPAVPDRGSRPHGLARGDRPGYGG